MMPRDVGRLASLLALVALSTAGCEVDITGGSSNASSTTASTGAGGTTSAGGATMGYPELILADHPVAYWRFEEVGAEGTIVPDEVGTFGFDGTYSGTPAAGIPLVRDSASALRIDGDNDGAVMGSILSFAGGEDSYSVEAWIQPEQHVDALRTIVWNHDCCESGWMLVTS